ELTHRLDDRAGRQAGEGVFDRLPVDRRHPQRELSGTEPAGIRERAIAGASELEPLGMVRTHDFDLVDRDPWIANPQARPPFVRAGLELVLQVSGVRALRDLPA